MSDMRNRLSEKNPYWLPKHRYLELKHFCLQYPEWKRTLEQIGTVLINDVTERVSSGLDPANPTERAGLARVVLSENIRLIETMAREADNDIWRWILYGVANGVSFDYLKLNMEIPCERDMYYNRYRKFFWLLDKYRT